MKLKSIAVFFFVCTTISGLAQADPAHNDGYVIAGDHYMHGAMSVRHTSRTDQDDAYVGGTHFANSSVHFYAVDEEGDYFSCYVPTSSALYAEAVDIKNNFTNGSFLYASKPSDSNQCSYISLRKTSYYLD